MHHFISATVSQRFELKVHLGGGSVVVDLLFGVLPIGCVGSVFVFFLLCITLCPF